MKIKTRKIKKWWKNHWDEVMLIVGFSIAFILLLKANGYF